jgi:hypothetical protein
MERKKLFRLLGLLLFIATFSFGCSQKPAISEVEITREVTREVTVEIIKEITQLVVETREIPVTVTPSETPQNTATITQSPTITLTPTETPTITPTFTQTKPPGVGAELPCGDYFIVKVNQEPRKETAFYGERAQGEFWLLSIDITNLMNSAFKLSENDFIIQGTLNGNNVDFLADDWDITWDWVYHHYGQMILPWDELVAGLSATVGIGFDINPNAEDFKLVWFPRDNMFDDRDEALCEVVIPLE